MFGIVLIPRGTLTVIICGKRSDFEHVRLALDELDGETVVCVPSLWES